MQPLCSGWRAHIGEDWSQGRATFGGMVAALCNEAMRRLVPADRELRGLDTTFAGPALVGEVNIDAEVLRAGKAVTIARSRLWSDGKIAATLTGIYGAARTTALPRANRRCRRARRRGCWTSPPSWAAHPSCSICLPLGEGTRPFAGSSLAPKIYVRHRDPAPLRVHVVALVDSILGGPAAHDHRRASSSLTWTVQLLRHDFSFAPNAWWRIDAESIPPAAAIPANPAYWSILAAARRGRPANGGRFG